MRFKIAILCCFFAMSFTGAWGQGLSRSHGLGFHGGIWKANQGGGFKTEVAGVASVMLENIGGSGSMYFFTRLSGQWFLETAIGGAGISGTITDAVGGSSQTTSMVMFLTGGRYDFLPQKFGSIVAPYLSLGLGGYWVFETEMETGAQTSVVVGGDIKTGYYAGIGMNLAVCSWFFVNLDFKTHFVDFTDDNHLSGTELGLGLGFMWGKKKNLFRVVDIKVIVPDIYPAYLPFYKSYPIAMVAIKNTVGFPIEVNLISQIVGFTERSSESGFIRIAPGERKDIPVKAIFGQTLAALQTRQQAALDLEIEARAGVTHRRTISAPLTVHHRNSWDGEIERLPFFVTPEASVVLDWVRPVTDSISVEGCVKNVEIARALVGKLHAHGLKYRSDPNLTFYQDDRVQFAKETLELKGGDCDDLSVLLASLLEGAGIQTAFIDVVDPEKAFAHVYLLMDTGLTASELAQLTGNEKRIVLRDNKGEQQVWLPVECTLLSEGFDKAWEFAAMNYLEAAVLRNGLSQGWVRIIDVE
ncbi:hypothetical protein KAR48_04865 [bacterium]|nr:hypothetical protein [bacterium]